MATQRTVQNWGILLATLFVATAVAVKVTEDIDKKEQEPSPSASVVASLSDKGVQNNILSSLPVHCQQQGKPIEVSCLDYIPKGMVDAVTCPNEDGTGTKGQACIWMDPKTRKLYFVISD